MNNPTTDQNEDTHFFKDKNKFVVTNIELRSDQLNSIRFVLA